ncbi:MAG: YciI family protein [Alphaproteobacteria bacterium]|nr:YciI family protein [Alphaproteobacteria bacterium]
MLYAIFCYNDEKVTSAWSREEDAACMAALGAVQEGLKARKTLGPVARLMPTTAAVTLRKGKGEPLVIDGPFAETKEQLLGFYVVDCADLEAALQIARDLGVANPTGAYEIRPMMLFDPGTGIAALNR